MKPSIELQIKENEGLIYLYENAFKRCTKDTNNGTKYKINNKLIKLYRQKSELKEKLRYDFVTILRKSKING